MNLKQAQQKLLDAGLESRQGQLGMMELVETALKQKKIAVIEGGTGIGKTFGYLIPALLNKPHKKKLIIATATVSLQAQLAYKDIPKLEKLLDLKIKAEIAKGRGRYICQQKLYHFQESGSQSELALFGIETINAHQQADQDSVNRLIELLDHQQWHGDRDTLPFALDATLWRKLTTDSVGCSNRRCQFFEQCSFFQARKKLRQAEVIVTNHDLLLSDLSKGSGVVLPKSEDCIYIIDEAHHFPEKAINHFASSVHTKTIQEWLETVNKSLLSIEGNIDIPTATQKQAEDAINGLTNHYREWQQFLNQHFDQNQQQDVWLLENVNNDILEITQSLLNHSEQLQTALYQIRQILSENYSPETLDDFELYLNVLSYHTNRIDQSVQTWRLFNRLEQVDHPPVARWIENKSTHKRQSNDYQVFAAMTSASNILPQYLWQNLVHGTILCSATLRALGQFDTFLHKVGLMNSDCVVTQHFLSLFPYQQSKLVIPSMQHEPKGASNEAHADEVAQLIPEILAKNQAGALVLFTSHRMMECVIDELSDEFLDDVLIQSDLPKHKLLEKHLKKVDDGKRSILFGLQSFAEGIDLPGQYCEHVVITKLPFAVPTTPIEKTRSNWMTQQGKNAFMDYSLPEASIRLTQYVGRLVRNHTDIGQVTILDRRIISKFYGKRLLDNLPDFEKVII